MVKILTGCQEGSLGTKLGQSLFGCLVGYILKTYFIFIFPYEFSLQCNLNHSIPISYEEFMTKTLTACHKSALWKICLPSCSLVNLTHQFLLSLKPVYIGDTYKNVISSPIGITSIRHQTKKLFLNTWLLV